MTLQPMKPEIKARWIKALRSDKYAQGTTYLNRDDQYFCCLGVLCELALEDGIVTKYTADIAATGEYTYRADTDTMRGTTAPPESVLEWSGLDAEDPMVMPPTSDDPEDGSLMGLNDYYKLSFHEIADLIEKQL